MNCQHCGDPATHRESIPDNNPPGVNLNEGGYKTVGLCPVHAIERSEIATARVEAVPELIEAAYFAAHKAAEETQPGSLRAEDFRLKFEPETGKYACEHLRPVPGQRKGLKRPKMEAARYAYDEKTVLIMIRGLRDIASGKPLKGFACKPDPNAGAFL